MAIIEENPVSNSCNKFSRRDIFSSPLMRRRKPEEEKRGRNHVKKSSGIQNIDQGNEKNGVAIHTQALANLEKLITKLKEDDCKPCKSETTRLPRSQPSSPAPTKKGILSNNFLEKLRI